MSNLLQSRTNNHNMDPKVGAYPHYFCNNLLLLAHVAENDYFDDKKSGNHADSLSKEELYIVHKTIKAQTNIKDDCKLPKTDSTEDNIFDLTKSKSFELERKQRIVRTATFAMKLMSVLTEKCYSHVISWLDDGKAFIILDQETFTRYVLPKEFKTAKYESFTRKLYRWGFRRVANSAKDRAFYHPLFLRKHPLLCRNMRSGNLVNEMGVVGKS